MTRFNYNPDRTVFIDLETQSAANLNVVGGKAYVDHPSTRLMCCVARVYGTVVVWVPEGRSPGGINRDLLWPDGFDKETILFDTGPGCPPIFVEAIQNGYTFVAHHAAGFDAYAWERLVGGPQPTWLDTVPLARAKGLPGGLDAISKTLFNRGKDEGKEALKLLYTVKERNGEYVYPVGTVKLWESVLRYNIADVLLLEKVYDAVKDSSETDVLQADAAINGRGFAFDRQLLFTLKDLWLQAGNAAAKEVDRLTSGAIRESNIRSVQQVRKWLVSQGLNLNSLNRVQLEHFYADPEAFIGEVSYSEEVENQPVYERAALCVEVLKLRQTATRISKGKIDRIIELADSDDRIRNLFVYHKAHTGRWSSRGPQLHNLARGVSDLDVEGLLSAPLTIDAIKTAASRCKGNPGVDDCLNTLLRPVFTGAGKPLLIADYGAIEARGVAWCAGEERLLQIFSNPAADVYCDMAGKIFGRTITKADKAERQIGKVTVLGSGYGMGANKFALYCRNNRIDLEAAGTSAEACIEAFRDAFPAIAGKRVGKYRRGGLWKEYQRCAFSALERPFTTFCYGECEFIFREHLQIFLPSGRALTYRNARIEDRVPAYCAILGLPLEKRPALIYDNPHGYEGTLYGGLIAENIVQGIGRDILAKAIVRLEAEKFFTVFHCHDEVASEDHEYRLPRLCEVMSDPPPWAKGFPIIVEGFTCSRYSKSAFSDSLYCTALNGKVL